MGTTLLQWVAATLFATAILHTFATSRFERLARQHPAHAGLWHLLGEVEVVFGFWACVLVAALFLLEGMPGAVRYMDSRNFTEPLFVFAIMVIAGTHPILQASRSLVQWLSRLLPLPGTQRHLAAVLTLVPLLGSFITEPAAMTLAALLLGEDIFAQGVPRRLRYAILGVLFVNVSIGGTLTPFAAPPVLMVASHWQWDAGYMMIAFGWKAALAVTVNAFGVTLAFRKSLAALPMPASHRHGPPVPLPLLLAHLAFLGGVVVFARHPPLFMALLLCFLGVAHAYERHQSPLILREGLLVACFLAGLVTLGGLQQWWLQPLLMGLDHETMFVGALLLTAITDNAALTYLGSLVEGLSDSFKYALVAGAVAGGGLTVIANAPNPAGIALLRRHFEDNAISPISLLFAALPPTAVAVLAFWAL